jgi:hypothetical protein
VPNSAQRRAFVYSGLKSLAHEIFRCIATYRDEPAEICILAMRDSRVLRRMEEPAEMAD